MNSPDFIRLYGCRHDILEPDIDAGRAEYFTALGAADRRDFQPLVDIWRDRLAHAETSDA